MRLPTPVVVGLILAGLAMPAAAQTDPGRKPVPKEQDKEEFPRWTVSGTFSTDISAVEADKHQRNPIPEEGFTGEFTLGATYHVDKSLTVTVQACVGCHSFELQSGYFDWEMSKTWTFRAGRIPVPFGGFSRRTDPSHVESGTKPLPYIMGGMVQQMPFNMGIVPAPFVDNGAAITGSFWFSQAVKFTLETAVMRGLVGNSPDLDFDLGRDFEDNNGEPAVAMRALVSTETITTGGSFSWGRYDEAASLEYLMGSLEFQIRFGQWSVRLEGVMRDTDFFTPSPFVANRSKETSRRSSYVVQVDGPITDGWRAFVLHDYLRVEDVFLGPTGPSSVSAANTTDDLNTIMRVAGGFVYQARAGLQFKGSVEYWDPSDFEKAIVFHLGVVASY